MGGLTVPEEISGWANNFSVLEIRKKKTFLTLDTNDFTLLILPSPTGEA